MTNSTREKLNKKLKQNQLPPIPKELVPDPNTENPIMNLVTENPYATAAILVTAIMTIVTYVLSLFGINLPAAVITAATAILSFFIGRWTRLSKDQAQKLEGTK